MTGPYIRPVIVNSLESFAAAFGLVVDREDPDDDNPFWQRLPVLRAFGWEDGQGRYDLWNRAGERDARHGPPYDSLAILCSPSSWGIGIDYETDRPWRSYGYVPRPGDRNRSVSIQLGPFHLYLGRTW